MHGASDHPAPPCKQRLSTLHVPPHVSASSQSTFPCNALEAPHAAPHAAPHGPCHADVLLHALWQAEARMCVGQEGAFQNLGSEGQCQRQGSPPALKHVPRSCSGFPMAGPRIPSESRLRERAESGDRGSWKALAPPGQSFLQQALPWDTDD